MTNSPLSTSAVAFLTVVFCGSSLLAQQATQVESPDSPPAIAAAPQSDAVSPGIRIVRLSQVNGEVQLDRQTGRGFEAAFANLPIVQGGRLRTGNGVAEVEFEDNSSLRLTPNSLVEFPVLSLSREGTRASTIHVVEGAVYVSLTRSKGSNVNLTFGKETLALNPSAHIELALNGKQPRLDVMDGAVQATNGATTTTVGRKKALLFDSGSSNAPTLVSKNEKGAYDAWDKQAVDYHQRLAPTNGQYASTPYAYGLNDMNYYGNFTSLGGCGTMWRPYLASANWSPYANGLWAWYPGAGYSWVSPYPWGWTAFHSGSWNLCNGNWGWQPGSQWNGLRNTPLVSRPGSPIHLRPPARPLPLGATMVSVNEKPLVTSKMSREDAFTFRQDSAGLGVPRSTFGKLNHISAGVARHGSMEKPVYVVSSPSTWQQEHASSLAAGHGATASHTTLAGSHSTASSYGSTFSGSSRSSGPSSSTASFGGSGASLGGSGGGSHGSGGGHH